MILNSQITTRKPPRLVTKSRKCRHHIRKILYSSPLNRKLNFSLCVKRFDTLYVSCSFPECSHPRRRHVQRETSVGVCPELLTEQRRTCTGRWYADMWWFICNTRTSLNNHWITCRVHQINNAGCMVNQRELTEEGLEKNFATNTLGKVFSNMRYLSLATDSKTILFVYITLRNVNKTLDKGSQSS